MAAPAPIPGVLLLGIDLQPVFLKAIADSESVQRRCAFAIEAATGLGIPVAFTEQLPRKLGGTAPEQVKKAIQRARKTEKKPRVSHRLS